MDSKNYYNYLLLFIPLINQLIKFGLSVRRNYYGDDYLISGIVVCNAVSIAIFIKGFIGFRKQIGAVYKYKDKIIKLIGNYSMMQSTLISNDGDQLRISDVEAIEELCNNYVNICYLREILSGTTYIADILQNFFTAIKAQSWTVSAISNGSSFLLVLTGVLYLLLIDVERTPTNNVRIIARSINQTQKINKSTFSRYNINDITVACFLASVSFVISTYYGAAVDMPNISREWSTIGSLLFIYANYMDTTRILFNKIKENKQSEIFKEEQASLV